MAEYVWQKSSFSPPNGSECIEFTADPNNPDRIGIRESDNPDVVVWTTRAKVAAFLPGVKAGEFDGYGL